MDLATDPHGWDSPHRPKRRTSLGSTRVPAQRAGIFGSASRSYLSAGEDTLRLSADVGGRKSPWTGLILSVQAPPGVRRRSGWRRKDGTSISMRRLPFLAINSAEVF